MALNDQVIKFRCNVVNNRSNFISSSLNNKGINWPKWRRYFFLACELTGEEEISTPFGPINTLVVEATADEVGPIIYYIAPEFDYLIIQSQAILKNGEKRILSIKERPKFLAE